MLTKTITSLSALLILAAAPIPVSAQAAFEFKDTPGQTLDIVRGGKVVARYMYAHDTSTKALRDETYKPYLHVFDPAGLAPITKGAGGDFTHHRGIYIGWMKIGVGGKSYDRWHMKGGDQIHEKFLAQKADKDGATFTSVVRWDGESADKPILQEERTLSVHNGPAGAYAQIDMVSKIKAIAGDTTLDGDPEHSGLQFRPANEVERSKTLYIYPKENAQPHKDRDYPWFGETFSLKDQRYSVVYLNHPANPKDAPTSAYRDYGRFGVFFRTSIKDGATAEFKARFLVFAGELPTPEAIQKAYNEYAGTNEPTPKVTNKTAEYGKSPDTKKLEAKKADATPSTAPVKP